MTDDLHIQAARTIDAPPERVFAMLADPDRHPEIDGSGTLRKSHSQRILRQVGDVFTMDLHAEDLGDYQTRSVVTHYERDRAIGWAPGPVDGEPFGHTFTYSLESEGAGRTLVCQTYDWSGVTDEQLLSRMPRVSRAALTRTLDKLANAL